MIDFISVWVQKIIYTIIFINFLEILIPNNSMKKYVKVITGLLIILVIISPITKLLNGGIEIEDVLSKNFIELKGMDIEKKQYSLEEHQNVLTLDMYKERLGYQIKKQIEKILPDADIKVEIEVFNSKGEDNYGEIKEIKLYLTKKEKENYTIKTIEKIEIGQDSIIEEKDESKNKYILSSKKEKEVLEYLLDFYNVSLENITINIQKKR